MEICLCELTRECCWDQHAGKEAESGFLLRKKELDCDTDSAEASANPVGNTEAGVTLQSCLELGQRAWIFILPQEGGVPFS